MKVLVIGAGIGGLTTALRLHRTGIECTVHEQSEQLRELGVGLNLLPHAVRELAELDLLDGLDAVAVRTTELIYAHRLGATIVRRPCGLQAGFELPQLSLHRGRLQGVLLAAVRDRLGPHAVRTRQRLVGFEQDADGVRARFADGTSVSGDALVGADGIHSAVRAQLVPDEGPPRWNGVQMWRGASEWPQFRGGRSMIVSGGTAAKLVIYPIGPGTRPGYALTNWALCIRTGRDGDPPPRRQDWSRPADRAELARHLGTFRVPDVDHAGLIESTAECFEFPMCDRDPLPQWTYGRVTLLGDAAHPMYPMGSNGGVQAVLDAESLGRHLAAAPEPAAALRAYDAERRPVTGEIVLRNRLGGPEGVIDEVDRRAPNGFTRLADVISAAEIDAVLSGYATMTEKRIEEP
jgi:2-polyprenyl-6-methoxyphenol hydroxylase-like FAD-dependent oxidoreductase